MEVDCTEPMRCPATDNALTLEDRLSLYREIFVEALDGVAVIDPQGRYLEQNRAHLELLGYSDAELAGRTPAIHLGEAAFATIRDELIAEGKSRGRFTSRTRDGRDLVVDLAAFTLRDAQGEVLCHVGIKRDVTEAEATARERDRALDEARAASQARIGFMANVSHELRTPLNGILGLTDLLSEAPLDSQHADYLRRLRRATEDLRRLVDDVLDYSRLDVAELPLERDPFEIHEVLGAVVSQARLVAEPAGLDLELGDDLRQLGPVVGDAGRVRQVLSNLVDNALKFTEAGGRVRVQGAVLADEGGRAHLQISVSDTGVGIAPDEQRQIFDSFTRFRRGTPRGDRGTGLGLAISSRLAEQMEGNLRVESALGEGSTFYFDAPFERAPSSPPARPELPLSTPPPAPDSPPRRALIVEDDEISRFLVTRLLERQHWEVEGVGRGEEALERLAASDFDLVLMDVHLPGLDGFETTRLQREREAGGTRRVPILALTASAMSGDREACLQAGMDHYLAKPISVRTFYDAVEVARASAEALAQG